MNKIITEAFGTNRLCLYTYHQGQSHEAKLWKDCRQFVLEFGSGTELVYRSGLDELPKIPTGAVCRAKIC
jgi:predicted nuclease of restriction endonuclease-like (RecB) superfamily